VESTDAGLKLLDGLARAAVASPGDTLVPGSDADFQRLTQVPLAFHPGAGVRCCSRASTLLLAHLITKVAGDGRSAAQLATERVLAPLGMVDSGWFVAPEKLARLSKTFVAAPRFVGTTGLAWTGANGGHRSWLGWRAADVSGTDHAPAAPSTQMPQPLEAMPMFYSTAADYMAFMETLMRGGTGAGGERVLSQRSARLMTTGQLAPTTGAAGGAAGGADTEGAEAAGGGGGGGAAGESTAASGRAGPVEGRGIGKTLGMEEFNTHAKDHANSSGQHPMHAVHAPGQDFGYGGLCTVADPATSRQAGNKGTFSGASGDSLVEAWVDPAHQLCVFVGTPVGPVTALPEMRQELAALVYGAMLPPAAAKLYQPPQVTQPGGQMMNMLGMAMYMMTMMPTARL
jgi:CubicO group peptidase (beta-lactamase class C family)